MARTVEEKFMIRIFEAAIAEGDPNAPINAREVGRSLAQGERAITSTIRLMAQANFIKKVDEDTVILTDNGRALVHDLLS